MQVEHFARQTSGAWQMSDYSLPDHVLPLANLGCKLPLAQIYERVTFPAPQGQP